MAKLLIVCLMISVTFQDSGDYVNEHVRRIYYDEWDNMCDGHGSDGLIANFFFQDREKITGYLRSGTRCDQWRKTGAAQI